MRFTPNSTNKIVFIKSSRIPREEILVVELYSVSKKKQNIIYRRNGTVTSISVSIRTNNRSTLSMTPVLQSSMFPVPDVQQPVVRRTISSNVRSHQRVKQRLKPCQFFMAPVMP